MRLIALAMVLAGCGATQVPAAEHTLPPAATLTEAELPPAPERPADGWTAPAEDVIVGMGDVRSGVLFSDSMAGYVGRLRIEYDRIRGLYLVDLRAWAREREVAQRYLRLADEEIERLRRAAERSWWELNGDEVMLTIGVILGVAASVGIGAALDGAIGD